MKKGFLILVSLVVCGALFAQWTGTKTSYSLQQSKYAPTPKGYKPFFINHVGRHGSRFMTKAGGDSLLLKILLEAKKENSLTDLGKKWLANVEWLTTVQDGHYNDISLQGAEEHKQIAARMRKLYPSLFNRGDIDVWYTHKIRTYQSAQGFLQSLKDYPKSSISYLTQPESDETMLRFYDYSPDYDKFVKSSIVKSKIDSVQNTSSITEVENAVALRFIHKNIWGKWAEQKSKNSINGKSYALTPENFTQALFDVYGVGLSAKIEMKTNKIVSQQWISPFTKEEGKILGKSNDVEDYLVKGPGLDKNGIQAAIAWPLLENFIATSDSAVNGTLHKEAEFRFTHAEAISPFATLLEIKGTDSVVNAISNFDKVWNAANIIPMAANIQWIFYSNGKNVLVKILLNEKESRLPIPTQTFPYYKWDDVKAFYSKKIALLRTQTDINTK
ncbi:MAG: hypothetical protein DI598_00080 [Pseudopedobacter saltans]|uniref:Multiple inositol polyphosphate phosphatase 1 n=1 Tax=Pseudopedobacter saltans TaxID=151895 RepID=A0A2W5FG52_9SPHI|nr:MAG: hypothetical protein DI598_00080 [Pseudopedobacter saltans]